MTATMNVMQSQLMTLSVAATKGPKIKYYCWSCGRNFSHGRKACPSRKSGHIDETYLNKIIGGIEKGCKLRLGLKMNEIKMSTPKISLIDNIGTPPNYPRKYTLAISDSGANIHLENEITVIMSPVILSKDMTVRPPDEKKCSRHM